MTSRIIDTHVHLWDREKNSYPFFEMEGLPESFSGDITPIKKTYVLDDYLADVGDLPVKKIVHVQANMEPADPVKETQWLQSIADQCGLPNAIVGFAQLDDPDVEKVLKGHARHPNFRGIRQILSWHEDPYYNMTDRPDYLTDPGFQAGYALLAKYGMSFDLQIFPSQLRDSIALAEKNPDVPLIVEHCALPVARDDAGLEQWRQGMREMAHLSHTVVKLSALTLLDHNWTRDSLAPIIRESVQIFGPDRTMFGSDFPIEKVHIRYDQWVDAVKYALSDLDEDKKDAIFYRTAERVYRI